MLKITKVKRKSVAKAYGIEIGDEITSFDNLPCQDELDYLYYNGQERFSMQIKDHRTGEINSVDVEKDACEDLGLEIEKTCDIRTCQNRCVFCFVDQMPKGMRESLYVKDDDYAMSFTCGNFVTLTNVADEALDRIIRLQLSPLYISVHTTNPDLRVKLLRNRHAGKILEQVQALAKSGIKIHCQAVIVPGENDGAELEKTARDLFALYPAVQDLAIVPTGLTKYRENLYKIDDVDKAYSEKLLDLVDRLNAEFKVNFLLPADEYFVKAERAFKNAEFYGDFEQIENGIGMTTKFIAEVESALLDKKVPLKKPKKSLIISGVSAKKVNEEIAKKCQEKITGLTVEVLAVENEFFGRSVTCTGLLTGEDICSAVEKRGKDGVDEIVLAGNTMKEFEDVFLCGMTLSQMQKRLGFARVCVNRDGGSGLVEILSANVKKRR